MNEKKQITFGGPGALIAAAFIGPGTVTVCTLAGASYGFELLWAMAVSVLVTIILQEMAARIGIITQLDLSSLIKKEIRHPVLKALIVVLVFSAIVIGNAAYEAGNITGGAMGLATFLPAPVPRFIPATVGLLAFGLLWFGSYKVLEKSLIAMVLLMSCSFLITAILTKPNLNDVLEGFVKPTIPENGLLMVMGLIGTTIVPYNLFLHASLAKDKWKGEENLPAARKDTIASILMGGLISVSVILTASVLSTNIETATDLALGLEPLYGSSAKYLLSTGLFAAGITSAITAPLAAAYVASGCFGWSSDIKSRSFRTIWVIILGIGIVFSSIGFKPVDIIRFAQITNGCLLPVTGFMLIWLCSKQTLLRNHANSRMMTGVGAVLLIVITLLGIKSIWVLF